MTNLDILSLLLFPFGIMLDFYTTAQPVTGISRTGQSSIVYPDVSGFCTCPTYAHHNGLFPNPKGSMGDDKLFLGDRKNANRDINGHFQQEDNEYKIVLRNGRYVVEKTSDIRAQKEKHKIQIVKPNGYELFYGYGIRQGPGHYDTKSFQSNEQVEGRINNNNMMVLPGPKPLFTSSPERKWWINGKGYKIYVPRGFETPKPPPYQLRIDKYDSKGKEIVTRSHAINPRAIFG